MTFTYGYEMETIPGRVVAPPMLHDKLSLTSSGNTSRFVFYGTRKEILDWMRQHANLVIEYNLFADGRPAPFQHPTEIIIDLQYLHDSEQTYANYFKSFFVSDYVNERVKVEIRPKLDSKDNDIMTMYRLVSTSGVKLGDVVDDLDHYWHLPARTYYRQAVDMYNDIPGPQHVLSAHGPSSIRVGTEASVQTEPPKPVNNNQEDEKVTMASPPPAAAAH
ncbi:hypothetical protein BDA99DRAFT_122041 [Phascolomyces articulosus]|uniref:Uncharacterized protein n=1 Tax=Phascolomyces articulosus TaxID=60185 RepID=A0AAD5KNI3_9FUNG|nr:hypothetical protein BDA99DRAFT_122041 [Phascolomyces articulosus]